MAHSALDKKRLMREIELDRRGNVAKKLKELSALLKAARSERRDSVDRVRKQCRTAREKLRTMCGVRKERACRAGDEAISARRREFHKERHLEKLQRAPDRRYELRRKEKALAEAAALLVLRKKRKLCGGRDEDASTESKNDEESSN